MDALDALAALPGSAQTVTDDIVDAEIVPRRNLPAVRDEPGELAVPDSEMRLLDQMTALATSWTVPTRFNRWRWAASLPQAIREGDPVTFRHLIMSALAHGFDGTVVSAGEFEVALLEFDVARAGAR